MIPLKLKQLTRKHVFFCYIQLMKTSIFKIDGQLKMSKTFLRYNTDRLYQERSSSLFLNHALTHIKNYFPCNCAKIDHLGSCVLVLYWRRKESRSKSDWMKYLNDFKRTL